MTRKILNKVSCYIQSLNEGDGSHYCISCYMRDNCPIANKIKSIAQATLDNCQRCPDGPAPACVQPGCKLYPVVQKMGE